MRPNNLTCVTLSHISHPFQHPGRQLYFCLVAEGHWTPSVFWEGATFSSLFYRRGLRSVGGGEEHYWETSEA